LLTGKRIVIICGIVVLAASAVIWWQCSATADEWMHERDKWRYRMNAQNNEPDEETGEVRPRKLTRQPLW
jgi:hypothetical protein